MSYQSAYVMPEAPTEFGLFSITEERYIFLRSWITTMVSIDVLNGLKTQTVLFTPFTWLQRLLPKCESQQEVVYVTFELTMTFAQIVAHVTDNSSATEQFKAMMQRALSIEDHFKTSYSIDALTEDHAASVFAFVQDKMKVDAKDVAQLRTEQDNKPQASKIISLDQQ